jgi:hypothetical protein
MQMVMNRNFLVQGLGHAIRFEKDKPVGVPPRLVAECRRYGAVPVEGENEIIEETEVSEFVLPKEEPQGEDRERILLQACDVLVGDNDNKKFGANGAPHVDAIKDLVKFRIDSTERNNIWSLYNRNKQAALNPSNVTEEATLDISDEVKSNTA